jgi:hypothetical protein
MRPWGASALTTASRALSGSPKKGWRSWRRRRQTSFAVGRVKRRLIDRSLANHQGSDASEKKFVSTTVRVEPSSTGDTRHWGASQKRRIRGKGADVKARTLYLVGSQQRQPERGSGGPHLLIQRGERKPASRRQFNISGVIQGEPKAISQFQTRVPNTGIRVSVDANIQKAEIGERVLSENPCQCAPGASRPSSCSQIQAATATGRPRHDWPPRQNPDESAPWVRHRNSRQVSPSYRALDSHGRPSSR